MKQIKGARLTGLLNNDHLIQTSRGKISEQGLQPDIFKEEKITDSGKRSLKATFDWAAQKLHFLHGGETALPADAQDTLSLGSLYKFKILSETRRERNFSAPHMFDM